MENLALNQPVDVCCAAQTIIIFSVPGIMIRKEPADTFSHSRGFGVIENKCRLGISRELISDVAL